MKCRIVIILLFVLECSLQPYLFSNYDLRNIHHGDNISIDCLAGPAASGDDHTYLKWMQLVNDSHTTVHTLPDWHKNNKICDVERLQIPNFSVVNNGVYVCSRKGADNISGNMLNASVNLQMISELWNIYFLTLNPTEFLLL